MEINFRSVSGIQIIEIKGALGETEAAAVRFKLEEKINQGRYKIVFELSGYEMTHDAARMLVLGLFQYALERGALTVASGIKAAEWPLAKLPGEAQVKMFLSLSEALDFAAKNEPQSVKDHVKEKLAGKKEDEIKESALKKLFEKYAIFQQGDDDDPFRLDFLSRQYRAAPHRDILAVEKKANLAVIKTQEEIQNLEKECDEAASRLKTLMRFRKSPLTNREIQIKQEALTKEIHDADLSATKLFSEVAAKRKEKEAVASSSAAEASALERAKSELLQKLKTTEENFKTEFEKLKQTDAREEAELEEKLKTLK